MAPRPAPAGDRGVVRRRRRWRPRAPKRRAAPNSTAAHTKPCAASIGSTPGSSARAIPASSRSMPRRRPAIRCRRSCAASRSRSRRTKPATCRCRTGRAATASGGLFARRACWPDQIPERAALAALKPLFDDPGVLKIGQDVKFDLADFRAARHRDRVLRRHDADVLCARCRRFGHALDALPTRYFNHAAIDFNARDRPGKTKVTFDCVAFEQGAPNMPPRTPTSRCGSRTCSSRGSSAERVTTVYETLERPLVPVLARMERRGISIDRQVLSRLSGEFAQRARRWKPRSASTPASRFNPGSPKQLGDILFGKLGLPGGTKTKTGQWSTGARALEELAEQGHELPQKILDWRQVSKLKSTYTDALPGFVNPTTSRVHTNYALASTTDRAAVVVRAQLQNIPVRTEEGRKIRRAFVADAGQQARLGRLFADRARLLAEIADIEPLRKAFRGGLDIHAMTASEMFGVPVKGMPPECAAAPRRSISASSTASRPSAWPTSLASRARRPAPHQEVLRALPRHPRLHGRVQGVRQEARLRVTRCSAANATTRRSGLEPFDPRLQRARRHQRAPAGHRRRHHPPRHDPHGPGAGRREARCADAATGARRTRLRGA